MFFWLIIFMEDLVRGLPLSTSAPRGSKNRPILRTNSKYYGGADKGGRGSKILKILRTYLMDSPLHEKIIELHVIFVTS